MHIERVLVTGRGVVMIGHNVKVTLLNDKIIIGELIKIDDDYDQLIIQDDEKELHFSSINAIKEILWTNTKVNWK